MPGSFLFATWSGGGNIHPLVALARQLVEGGHSVRVLGPKELCQRFESEQLPFRAHRSRAEVTGGATGTDARALALSAIADDLLTEVRASGPDVLVIDYMMPELLSAAETTGRPVVAFVHTLYQRVALAEQTPMAMSGGLQAINALRTNLRLPAVDSLPAMLDRAALVLVATALSLDRPELPLAANVRYAGPMLEDPAADASWAPPFADLDLPLVHVSMGTAAPHTMTLPVIQAAIDGLAGCDLNVFVTLPRAEDQPWSSQPPASPAALKLSPNTAVQPFTRHAAVMPHTSVFITHAGLGSVGAALSHGVPMVCVPLFLEQPDNAAHVEALGAGRVLAASASPWRCVPPSKTSSRTRPTPRRRGESRKKCDRSATARSLPANWNACSRAESHIEHPLDFATPEATLSAEAHAPLRTVTAVVVNWHSARVALNLLRALEPAFERGLRMVIVENGSTDDSEQVFRTFLATWCHSTKVTLLVSNENTGFTGGVNLGAYAALDGSDPPEFIWLLNPDGIATLETVMELLAVAAESGAGIVSAGPSTFRLGSWPGVFGGRRQNYSVREGTGRWWPCAWYQGACSLFRADLVRRLRSEDGFFQNPGIFMDWDEWECTLRATEKGALIVAAAEATFTHEYHSRVLGHSPMALLRQYYVARNSVYVARQNMHPRRFWPALVSHFARTHFWFFLQLVHGRDPHPVVHIEGTWDGIRGNLGRWRKHPTNYKTPAPAAE